MLKHNEVNPLAVFGLRRVEHCPPHFITVCFDAYVPEKHISDWIWENLSERFYIGDDYIPTEGGGMSMQKMVGFENPGEASLFSLVLNTINTVDNNVF
jgi:hypothetical protein